MNRDATEDYRRAYIAEYESYKGAGEDERAASVAAVLREGFGYEVAPRAPKETVAEPPAPERSVDDDEAPRRRPGRPRKTEIAED